MEQCCHHNQDYDGYAFSWLSHNFTLTENIIDQPGCPAPTDTSITMYIKPIPDHIKPKASTEQGST